MTLPADDRGPQVPTQPLPPLPKSVAVQADPQPPGPAGDLFVRVETLVLILITIAVAVADLWYFKQLGKDTDLLIFTLALGAGGIRSAYKAGLNSSPLV